MSDVPVSSTDDPTSSPIILIDAIGTATFVIAMAVSVPFREERSAQIAIAVLSMVLFAVGIATCLWAYTSALERSRTEEVGVANLFLLTGATAPRRVRRTMSLCLVVQVVAAVGGATVGVVGLEQDQLNALAFGVLVPMFGIGMNGLWAARSGAFGPRGQGPVQPTNRKID